VCCTTGQVEALSAKLQQADALINSCPACRNNFRDFFCAFTCSSNQSAFLNVSSTQTTNDGLTAVEVVDFYIGSQYGKGFFQSCKDIKFGPMNSYAMDLLGGGAHFV
jgi:Niemann-Pick C1 protein